MIFYFLVIHSMQEGTNGKNKAPVKDIHNENRTPGEDLVKLNIFSIYYNDFSRRTRTKGKRRGEY